MNPSAPAGTRARSLPPRQKTRSDGDQVQVRRPLHRERHPAQEASIARPERRRRRPAQDVALRRRRAVRGLPAAPSSSITRATAAGRGRSGDLRRQRGLPVHQRSSGRAAAGRRRPTRAAIPIIAAHARRDRDRPGEPRPPAEAGRPSGREPGDRAVVRRARGHPRSGPWPPVAGPRRRRGELAHQARVHLQNLM